MKILKCICGADNKTIEQAQLEEGPKLSPEEEACAAAKFLDEDKFWKRYAIQ